MLAGGKAVNSRDRAASLCGSLLVVLLLMAWSAFLVVGFALLYWPQLGTGLQSTSHAVDSFSHAFYYSGYSLTTLGLGDIYPSNDLVRVLTLAQSWLGFTLLTLSISYVLSVYQAVRHQESVSLKLHSLSGGTGEAFPLFRAIVSGNAAAVFRELNDDLIQLHTAHHQYPIIHYFHRTEEKYSTTRRFYLALESVSLCLSARREDPCSEDRACWITLRESVREFASMIAGFRPDQAGSDPSNTFQAGSERSTFAIETPGVLAFDEKQYAELRSQWEPYLRKICDYLGESWPESRGD